MNIGNDRGLGQLIFSTDERAFLELFIIFIVRLTFLLFLVYMSIVTNIVPFIPQRNPFVMVDTLEHCDEDKVTTTFTIKRDNLFVNDVYFTEPGLIENIAQTAAAKMGYNCHLENKPVPIGFIGAVQNLEIKKLPGLEDVLYTTVIVKNRILNAHIIEGVIKVKEEQIASCEMRIFIAETKN